MSWSADDLAALETAMRSGTVSVRYADRTITYRSLAEMNQLRDQIRAELGLVANGGRTRRYLEHSKGV